MYKSRYTIRLTVSSPRKKVETFTNKNCKQFNLLLNEHFNLTNNLTEQRIVLNEWILLINQLFLTKKLTKQMKKIKVVKKTNKFKFLKNFQNGWINKYF